MNAQEKRQVFQDFIDRKIKELKFECFGKIYVVFNFNNGSTSLVTGELTDTYLSFAFEEKVKFESKVMGNEVFVFIDYNDIDILMTHKITKL